MNQSNGKLGGNPYKKPSQPSGILGPLRVPMGEWDNQLQMEQDLYYNELTIAKIKGQVGIAYKDSEGQVYSCQLFSHDEDRQDLQKHIKKKPAKKVAKKRVIKRNTRTGARR